MSRFPGFQLWSVNQFDQHNLGRSNKHNFQSWQASAVFSLSDNQLAECRGSGGRQDGGATRLKEANCQLGPKGPRTYVLDYMCVRNKLLG